MANKQNKTINKPVRKKRATKKEKPVGDTPYTQSEWDAKIKEYFKTHKPSPWVKKFSGFLKGKIDPKKTTKELIADTIEEHYAKKAERRK